MTNDELVAIADRAAAATPGPWLPNGYYQVVQTANDAVPPGAVCRDGNTTRVEADRDFIAHARTDVPALIAEVIRLRSLSDRQLGELEVLRAAVANALL